MDNLRLVLISPVPDWRCVSLLLLVVLASLLTYFLRRCGLT